MQGRGLIYRVIPFVLVFIVSVSSLAVPAKAAEVSNNTSLVDLTDYSTLNGSGEHSISFDGDATISYDTPEKMFVTYVDMVITCGYSRPPVKVLAGNAKKELTITKISDGLYRIYGQIPQSSYTSFPITFENGDDRHYYFIVNYLYVGNFTGEHAFTPCHGLFQALEYYEHIYRDPATADPAFVHGVFNGSIDDSGFTLDMDVPLWRNYDYIDIRLFMVTEDITSVNAYYGNITLPVYVSSYSGVAAGPSARIVTIRVDFRGIDRTLKDKDGNPVEPVIYVSGNLTPNEVFRVHIQECSGYVEVTPVDPVIYFIKQLATKMESWFAALGNTFTSAFDGLKAQLDGWFRTLVDAIYDANSGNPSGDVTEPTETDPTEDIGATQESQMDELLGDLEDVTYPSLDDVPADIEDIVDGNAVILATSGLAVVMNNPVLSTLFTLCLVFSVAAYVLFGKR